MYNARMETKDAMSVPWVVFTNNTPRTFQRAAAFAALLVLAQIKFLVRTNRDEEDGGSFSSLSFSVEEQDRPKVLMLFNLTDFVSVESPSFLNIVISKEITAQETKTEDGIIIGFEAAKAAKPGRFDKLP